MKVLTVGLADDAGVDLVDVDGLLAQRYGLSASSVVLLRPDQHVCARWKAPDASAFGAALRRAQALH